MITGSASLDLAPSRLELAPLNSRRHQLSQLSLTELESGDRSESAAFYSDSDSSSSLSSDSVIIALIGLIVLVIGFEYGFVSSLSLMSEAGSSSSRNCNRGRKRNCDDHQSQPYRHFRAVLRAFRDSRLGDR